MGNVPRPREAVVADLGDVDCTGEEPGYDGRDVGGVELNDGYGEHTPNDDGVQDERLLTLTRFGCRRRETYSLGWLLLIMVINAPMRMCDNSLRSLTH